MRSGTEEEEGAATRTARHYGESDAFYSSGQVPPQVPCDRGSSKGFQPEMVHMSLDETQIANRKNYASPILFVTVDGTIDFIPPF